MQRWAKITLPRGRGVRLCGFLDGIGFHLLENTLEKIMVPAKIRSRFGIDLMVKPMLAGIGLFTGQAAVCRTPQHGRVIGHGVKRVVNAELFHHLVHQISASAHPGEDIKYAHGRLLFGLLRAASLNERFPRLSRTRLDFCQTVCSSPSRAVPSGNALIRPRCKRLESLAVGLPLFYPTRIRFFPATREKPYDNR